MFNPIKFILNSVLSWALLIAVVGGGYFVYINQQSKKYNPEGVASIFTELVQNPTQVISSGDNAKIDSIIDTQVLSTSKIEEVILALRGVDETLPISLSNIETNAPFSTATMIFGTAKTTTPTIKLFMEETGEWYTAAKNKVFHMELLNFESLTDIKLDVSILDKITDITKSLGENLDKIKGGYGNDIVNDILKEKTTN